jgi:hypothetical protein
MATLKNCNSPGYKAIACKTIKKWYNAPPLGGSDKLRVAIDVRSCLFKYIRNVVTQSKLKEKIACVLRIINNGISEERRRVADNALAFMKNMVNEVHATSAIFVFCSKEPCPFREPQKCAYRASMMQSSLQNLRLCLAEYRQDLLSMQALIKCYTAFETYLFNSISEICLNFSKYNEYLSTIESSEVDYFESDRLCANLVKDCAYPVDAIISEDYDLVALFGAKFIIMDVVNGYVQYVTLHDLMKTFGCSTRKELVLKCIIAGTDYNLGVKGFGYAKIVRMDIQQTENLVNTCVSLQDISIESLLHFFGI